jgi:hypothetical protein
MKDRAPHAYRQLNRMLEYLGIDKNPTYVEKDPWRLSEELKKIAKQYLLAQPIYDFKPMNEVAAEGISDQTSSNVGLFRSASGS